MPAKRLVAILAFASGAVLISRVPANAADDCPTAQSAPAGFVVERGESSKTEVLHVGATTVRTVYRYSGSAVLETTQFQGLFELERIDRGKRTVSKPTHDLAKLLPLKAGRTITGKFETTQGERRSNRTVILAVKKSDQLYIGSCQYKVLQIDRSMRVGDGNTVFLETDYYAPDLKLIIAKEYKESGGRTSLNKFDRIYPLKQ